MELTGLKWLGTRTDKFDEVVRFYRDVMGLEVKDISDDYAGFKLPDGDVVEVFAPGEPDHKFFTTGPVVGFGVDDVEAARSHLEAEGIEFIGEIEEENGSKWSHFYGLDGNVYEITGP